MANPLLNFKIILCNVLDRDSLGAVSNETEFCPTIADTRRSIEAFEASGGQIILGCSREDLAELLDLIFKDCIHAVFILKNNAISVMYNKQPRARLVEGDFLIDLTFEAAELVWNEADGKKNEDGQAVYNLRVGIFRRLLDLIRRQINQNR